MKAPYCHQCGKEIGKTDRRHSFLCMGCIGKVIETKKRPIIVSLPAPPYTINYDKVITKSRERARKEKKLLIIEFGAEKGVEDYREKR